MELYFSDKISDSLILLEGEEASHCARVMRHHPGDRIGIADTLGTMYDCEIVFISPQEVCAKVIKSNPGWNSHPYNLSLAVCPTKNIDRFENFLEKATEFGIDRVIPLDGDHSVRHQVNIERMQRIVLSACKQSLKAAVPCIEPMTGIKDFLRRDAEGLKFIACCFDPEGHPRRPLAETLSHTDERKATILIGPEGDFSEEELTLATECGFIPISLGESRLRVETAAILCAAQVYSLWGA